ncbi:MAG: hypothetical protein OSJ61_01875 [Lachnospiraceae bacterium]|nr:hypothetical protein [Lachnospiraceae bacterium]
MQNNPYGIDFKSEIKKYKMLCRGKNTQCKNYLEWRTYILSLIDSFDVKALENFRHFCLYQEELEKHGKDMFLALAVAFITLYFPLTDNTNTNGITLGIVAAIISFIIAYSYFDYNCSMGFYHDVAEIVKEKIESLPEEERLLIKINGDNSQKLLPSNSK